jgi:hypothetical protein
MKYEYFVLDTKMSATETQKILDDCGKNGWELVSVDKGVMYLKRQIVIAKR